METRISKRFDTLMKNGRKALIPFFTPGAQGELSIADTILALEEAGADLVEVGIPFSDPIADGPTIQRSAQLSLKNGVGSDDVFAAIKKARESTDIPILLLVYYNSIFKYGRERFTKACNNAGIDGLIIPDLPYEEQDEMSAVLNGMPIDLITLVARTSKDRLKTILPKTKGFVYCVSTVGVTGERSAVYGELAAFLDEIKSFTDTPRAVGFGISTTEQAKEISKYSEGVIVGSALVRRLMDEGSQSGLQFVRELRAALDQS